jgi:hypothetical protein
LTDVPAQKPNKESEMLDGRNETVMEKRSTLLRDSTNDIIRVNNSIFVLIVVMTG